MDQSGFTTSTAAKDFFRAGIHKMQCNEFLCAIIYVMVTQHFPKTFAFLSKRIFLGVL